MKNKNIGQGDPNAIYYQEMEKLRQERLDWLKKEGVKSEQEWYERRQLNAPTRKRLGK
jgi:hypothetical protein